MTTRKQVDPSPFGLYLAGLRRRQGLRQGDLARAIDCTRGFISLMELGQKLPSQKIMAAIMGALDLSAPEIEELKESVLISRGSLEFPAEMPLAFRRALCRYFKGHEVSSLGSWPTLARELAAH
jgi:transcriptional regulator with XRE-family HTH domain